MLLRFHGAGRIPPKFVISAELRLSHCGHDSMRKEFGLKARELKTSWSRLATTLCLPLRRSRMAAFSCSAKSETTRLSYNPRKRRAPELMSRADLEAIWDGRIVLMTRRASLTEIVTSLRHHLVLGRDSQVSSAIGEVLLGSFFLQLFAARLAAVLSGGHRQGSGPSQYGHAGCDGDRATWYSLVRNNSRILRTYLFSHATNRIDVELGARLFQHLLALPTAYFQARRVGDSVARVRELESIRTFLTSSALTLVIDLFFTFVFLGVMFIYSPLLNRRPSSPDFLSIWVFRRGDAAVSPAARREVQSAARRTRPFWWKASLE